jgi:uncharacterized membrane protein YfcA
VAVSSPILPRSEQRLGEVKGKVTLAFSWTGIVGAWLGAGENHRISKEVLLVEGGGHRAGSGIINGLFDVGGGFLIVAALVLVTASITAVIAFALIMVNGAKLICRSFSASHNHDPALVSQKRLSYLISSIPTCPRRTL